MKFLQPQKLIFGLASFTFTLFIFANAFEVLANQDIPLGMSLNQMEIQEPINKIVSEYKIKQGNKDIDINLDIGIIDLIEIEELDIKSIVEEARNINDIWYQRPSMAQYIELNYDKFNNPVDYLIYLKKSWRTIPHTSNIEIGNTVNISTKKGQSISYSVESIKILNYNDIFVASKSDKRQIILLIEDTNNSIYYGYSLVSYR